MKSHSRWCFALAALLSILPRLIDAQLPSATDAQREAGSMVASVEFDHDPIDLMVGDSVDLVARFLDADGNEIGSPMLSAEIDRKLSSTVRNYRGGSQ